MKRASIAVGVIFLLLGSSGSNAAVDGPDLTSPERAIRSFFSAIQANDLSEAKKTISPRCLWALEMRGHSLEEFVKGWRKFPLKDVRNVKISNDTDAYADVVLLEDGTEHSYYVWMEKSDNDWLWRSNGSFFTIEGGVNIEIQEGYQNYYSEEDPAIFLSLKTNRQYGCSNYKIRSQRSITSEDLIIIIYDYEDPGTCTTALGPARARFKLEVAPGKYKLRFVHGPIIDAYTLVVTDDKIEISGNDGSFAVPTTRSFQRYPRNSFVYLCGSMAETSRFCEDFHKALLLQTEFQEFTFPGGVTLPYPTTSEGHHYEMPAKYFTYRKDEDFVKAGELLRGYKLNVLKESMGVSIWLRNWRNKSHRSWMIEK